MSYNSDPNVQTLSEVLAMDPKLRPEAISRHFEMQSGQYNALKLFTSVVDPKTQNGGPRSIFVEKTDLSAGGAQLVNFNVIGPPGGPGAAGDQELTGRTSKSRMATYPVAVDWVRDAVELTQDEIYHLGPGANLERVTGQMLAEKMGGVKQNHGLKRLMVSANGNIYRPNNRATTNELRATDTLSLDVREEACARLGTMGAKPLKRSTAKSGCPIDQYLTLACSDALLPIKNDSTFQTAISHADVKGLENALFTGELLSWQGNPFFGLPVTDIDWDDYAGGPQVAKAVVGVEAKPTTVGGPKLIVNAGNLLSRYFQWFEGYQFRFSRLEEPADLSGNEYYGWAINPDGSRVFFAYAGNHNGNQITITKILAPAQTGTTIDQATVGQLNVGADAAYVGGTTGPFTVGGSGVTVPTEGPIGDWVYSDTIAPGAVILGANARGVTFTRSFQLGSMAACFAHGKIKMQAIKQDRDFDFVVARGMAMIFGTGVTTNTLKKPRNYILIEHAYEVTGYPVPSKIEA
jgi:hypothetical protein